MEGLDKGQFPIEGVSFQWPGGQGGGAAESTTTLLPKAAARLHRLRAGGLFICWPGVGGQDDEGRTCSGPAGAAGASVAPSSRETQTAPASQASTLFQVRVRKAGCWKTEPFTF